MGIILDTSFLVAVVNAKDKNHSSSESLKSRIANKDLGQVYISDYIFDEFVTFLKAKGVALTKVRKTGDALLGDEGIKLLKADMQVFLQAWELFKRSESLSFTDCITIQLAGQFGIKSVASYDSDFDKVPLKSLRRMES